MTDYMFWILLALFLVVVGTMLLAHFHVVSSKNILIEDIKGAFLDLVAYFESIVHSTPEAKAKHDANRFAEAKQVVEHGAAAVHTEYLHAEAVVSTLMGSAVTDIEHAWANAHEVVENMAKGMVAEAKHVETAAAEDVKAVVAKVEPAKKPGYVVQKPKPVAHFAGLEQSGSMKVVATLVE